MPRCSSKAKSGWSERSFLERAWNSGFGFSVYAFRNYTCCSNSVASGKCHPWVWVPMSIQNFCSFFLSFSLSSNTLANIAALTWYILPHTRAETIRLEKISNRFVAGLTSTGHSNCDPVPPILESTFFWPHLQYCKHGFTSPATTTCLTLAWRSSGRVSRRWGTKLLGFVCKRFNATF